MNSGQKNIESIDEVHARFVRRREQSVAPLSGKLTWVGSLLVLLVLAVASFNAAAQVAEGDGYQAALVNFRFIANTVWTTKEATQAIRESK
jgi:hypothetical protein